MSCGLYNSNKISLEYNKQLAKESSFLYPYYSKSNKYGNIDYL